MAERQTRRPRVGNSYAGPIRITLTVIASIFIVSILLYGLNHSNDSGGGAKIAPPIAATPPSGQGSQQAARQQGRSEQSPAPANPPQNPPTTTGQGNSQDNAAPNQPPSANSGSNSDAPAGASPSAGRPPGAQ